MHNNSGSDLKYILAKMSGIPCLVNWLNRRHLLVLAYHGVYDGPKRTGGLPSTFVHVHDMVEQLHFIRKCYRILDPEDFLGALEKGSGFPVNSALITFDDGYESFYRLVEPALRKLGIRAMVFIPTQYVKQNKPLWFDFVWGFIKYALPKNLACFLSTLKIKANGYDRNKIADLSLRTMKALDSRCRGEIVEEMDQISSPELQRIRNLFYTMNAEQLRELALKGTVFGGHTHTHTILSILPASKAEQEILENKRTLESIIGNPCHLFAYPNGCEDDFNDDHKRMLRFAGYKAAFSLTQKRSVPYDDPMDISRINVTPEDTVRSLSFRCAGGVFLIKRFQTL